MPALAAMLLLACGTAERTPQADSTAVASDEDSLDAAVAAELPPMPAYPPAEAGKLVVTMAGAMDLARAWPAKAGRCSQPSMVLLIAEEPGGGASILLELPASGDLTGEYPVRLVDSTGVVQAPASQVGLQFYGTRTADAYQASTGVVEVSDLTDRRLSGRLAVTVRHLATNQLVQVTGAFQRVDIEALPLDWCAQAAASRDSLAATRDTVGGS
jgi:hypothetical protein